MTALSLSLPGPRLIRAELLKLRKRRGLLAIVAAATLGASLVAYGILAILHAANPVHHGPAGGVLNLGHGLFVLALLGTVAATLVGATAGAGDLSSGVFRELAVTGRSRSALFRARIPGGLAFLLSFVGVAYGLAALATVVFAGYRTVPSAALLAGSGAWLLLTCAFWFALALGLASLVGSRSTVIGVLLAFQLAVTPILASIPVLGLGRELLPSVSLTRLAPHAVRELAAGGSVVPTSLGTAELVLAVWVLALLALGEWRTVTRSA
jgi:ABC-type transport system involved in multi-copper enzyme maturation permease subunit